jgi:hypothetical protein
MKRNAIGDGRATEIGPDITCRHCDACAKPMCCGEGFDHGGGHAAPSTPVTMLKQCLRPAELVHRKHFDLVGQCGDPRAKSFLNVLWKSGDWFRELSGHLRVRKGGAEPEVPQSGGRWTVGCKTIQIRRPLARQDVAQKVVVGDDGCHLPGRQIGIVEIADELPMPLIRQCVGEDLLTAAGRQEDHGVAQIDHRHSPTVIEPQRWRTAAGTDICPLVETRNSTGVARHGLSTLGETRSYQVSPSPGIFG